MAFPIIAIKNIERVYTELPLKKTDKKGHEIAKNVFEIHLNEDFLDIFLRHDYEKLFAPDSKRKNYHLMKIQKEVKMNASPSKKNIKELFHAEEENRPEEPLG